MDLPLRIRYKDQLYETFEPMHLQSLLRSFPKLLARMPMQLHLDVLHRRHDSGTRMSSNIHDLMTKTMLIIPCFLGLLYVKILERMVKSGVWIIQPSGATKGIKRALVPSQSGHLENLTPIIQAFERVFNLPVSIGA